MKRRMGQTWAPRMRKGFLIGGAIALAAVAALMATRFLPVAPDPKKQNFEAAALELFTLPDPEMGLLFDPNLDGKELQAALAEAGPEISFATRASPYCTERGLQMMSNLSRTIGRVGAGTENVTVVQSAALGPRDKLGYYPFTVTATYGPGQGGDGTVLSGSSGEAVTFKGTVGFDGDGLIDYFYLPNHDTTAFVHSVTPPEPS